MLTPAERRQWNRLRSQMARIQKQMDAISRGKPKRNSFRDAPTMPESPRARARVGVGSRVTLNVRPKQEGVFTVTKVIPHTQWGIPYLRVRRSDGLVMQVPVTAVRSAKNGVELYAVTYREQKKGDRKPHLYEHVFAEGGGARPVLDYDGRDLQIQRGRSNYFVKDGWIHK